MKKSFNEINDVFINPLPARLKTVRMKLGISRRVWGEAFGLQETYITYYENGHVKPTIKYFWLTIESINHFLRQKKVSEAFIEKFTLFMWRGDTPENVIKILATLIKHKITEEELEFGIFKGEVITSKIDWETMKKELPITLRTIREQQNHSRPVWGDMLFESRNNISNWETGLRRPSLSYLLKILYTANSDEVIKTLHGNKLFMLSNYQFKRPVTVDLIK